MSPAGIDWLEANRQHLAAAIAAVSALIADDAGLERPNPAPIAGQPFRLDLLAKRLSLTGFEKALLAMAAGFELDSGFAQFANQPTAATAFASLPDPHWSALAPDGALRRWRLIEPQGDGPLVHAPLRIDPALLHWLTGASDHASAAGAGASAVADSGPLPAPHRVLIDQLAARLRAGAPNPAFELAGGERSDRLAVAAAAAHAVGMVGRLADAAALPGMAPLWERELLLASTLPIVDPGTGIEAAAFSDTFGGPLFLVGPVGPTQRGTLRFELPQVTYTDRAVLWTAALGAGAKRGDIDRLAWQFALPPADIAHAAREAQTEGGERPISDRAWQQARARSRRDAGPMVRRVVSTVTLDDLVLPEAQRGSIEAIGAQVRQQAQVYGAWGLGGKSSRGLGISALFSGPSGAGKTTAAEALAAALDLDLLHIDLSQVVSKYIGETEKNLDQVFASAEAGGAVLLFDEADAIFGKRTEVSDSHDRYANLEISYLLQRMEGYRGLAILTTNQKSAIDEAFLRRIRFVVHFPFPDRELREDLWRRALPAQLLDGEPDWNELSRLSLAGGSIRNIALNAAFNAAEAGAKIGPDHIDRAVAIEGAKLEAPHMMLQLARARGRQ